MCATLTAVTYHYVRDLSRTRFPRIKGMLTDHFRHQVALLRERYEIATLESALAFCVGDYTPSRDLCLLTFDDGLRDHYTDVLPILAEQDIQGLFFIITSSIEEHKVASVHKNHFLMASLDFDTYREAFFKSLAELGHDLDMSVDMGLVRRTYPWDSDEVAAMKYLFSFRLRASLRKQVADRLFQEHLGDEREFAQQLYLSWAQAREMQREGMLMGGHSHNHNVLAALTGEEQQRDLETCATLLRQRLDIQIYWPFSYPYGGIDTFDPNTVRILAQNGFACAFATVPGETRPGDDLYALRRVDTKSVMASHRVVEMRVIPAKN